MEFPQGVQKDHARFKIQRILESNKSEYSLSLFCVFELCFLFWVWYSQNDIRNDIRDNIR